MAVIPTTSKCPTCGELLKWDVSRGFFDSKGHEFAAIPVSAPVLVREEIPVEIPESGMPSPAPAIPIRTVPETPPVAQEELNQAAAPKGPAIPVRTVPAAPAANGGPGVVFAPNGDAMVTIRVEQHHWSGLEAACRSGSWGDALAYFEGRVKSAFADRWFW